MQSREISSDSLEECVHIFKEQLDGEEKADFSVGKKFLQAAEATNKGVESLDGIK